MKSSEGFKLQQVGSNSFLKTLHKMMICVHSNTLCKLNDQARYKKCHLKCSCSGISMKRLPFKMEETKNHHSHKSGQSCPEATLCGHLGQSKCLHRAMQTTYWPEAYDQIYKLVTNSQTCLNFLKNNCKQSPSQHPQEEQLVP